jgi:hypothetical protein
MAELKDTAEAEALAAAQAAQLEAATASIVGGEPEAPTPEQTTEEPEAAPEAEEETPSVEESLFPGLPEDLAALTADEPTDESFDFNPFTFDEGETETQPEEEAFNYYDEEAAQEAKKREAALKAEIKKREDALLNLKRKEWLEKDGPHFPLAPVEEIAKTATSRKDFARKANAAQAKMAPIVEKKLNEGLETFKKELESQWGKPMSGPGVPDQAFAAQEALEKARNSGNLTDVFKVLIDQQNLGFTKKD